MKKTLITILAAVALTSALAFAHDASKHKGKPVQGEVVSSAGDRFEVKTETGIIPVTFSSKTKFEHGDSTVDKTHVIKGVHVSVFGTKLPSGEIVAREVLIGDAGNHDHQEGMKGNGAAKGAKKATSEPHKH
ncbi:MAG TPA: hypothetical protein VE621_19330 [Bryobacteraceae bacterium]|nr:hypothetical protein [Bryobacteraceae bacterium]